VNPLAFIALFKEKTLGWLAGTAALQSFGDYVNIYDINNLYMIKTLGYEASQIGNFAMSVGLSQIAGGKVTGELVKKVGLKAHVLIANCIWAIGMMTMGTARSTPHAFLALFLWTFGHQRANSVNVNLQTYGAAQGMGRGEIIASSSNLLAYVKIIVPLFYSNVFAWATSNGRNMPGLPYFIIAALTALSQAGYFVANPKA
jgi:predicted MFS family arabinose efflux permease